MQIKNKKMWVIIVIAVIFLFIGFYLYYFYPQYSPGMAIDDLSNEKNVTTDDEKQYVGKSDETESVLKENKGIAAKTSEDKKSGEENIKKIEEIDVEKGENTKEKQGMVYEDKTDTESSVTKEEINEVRPLQQSEKKDISEQEQIIEGKSTEKIEEDGTERMVEEKLDQEKTTVITDVRTEIVEKDADSSTRKRQESNKKVSENNQTGREQTGIINNLKQRIKNIYEGLKTGITGVIKPELNKNVDILVMGIDDQESVNKGRIEADAIILARLYPQENKVNLYSIIFEDEFIFGKSFSKEKAGELTSKVEKILGTDINYYFSISYEGFIGLINNIEGIEINLEDDFKVASLNLNLKTGVNTLTGEQTLDYARYLQSEGDQKHRIARQQQIISAIIRRALYNKSISDLPELIKTTINTFQMVDTNVEYSMITKIITFLHKSERLEINYKLITYGASSNLP